MSSNAIARVFTRILAVLLVLATPLPTPASGATSTRSLPPGASTAPVRLGVLAFRFKDLELERKLWQPLADHLSAQLPAHRFEIVPLGLDKIDDAVAAGRVDFVLTTPSNYVELEHRHGVTRILTMKTRIGPAISRYYGSVIFARADRADLNSLEDLRGKRFLASDERAFAGWIIAWRELRAQGIDPYSEFSSLTFAGGTHDTVVYAVRDGAADAGCVRADQLHVMEAQGKVASDAFKLLNVQPATADFPYPRSTRLYPHWALAVLKHTPEDLSQRVTIALLSLPADSPMTRSADCAGFTTPLDYSSVHECLKELRIGPYKDLGTMSSAQLARRFWYVLAPALIIIALLAGITLHLARLNRRLHHRELSTRVEGKDRAGAVTICKRSSKAIGGAVITLAAVAIAGWLLSVATLQRVAFPGPPMNPMTAIGLALAGMALWVSNATPPRRPLLVALAAGSAIVGIARLLDFFTGDALRADLLLYSIGPRFGVQRMALNTAAGFVLIGAALILLDVRTRRSGVRPAQWIALGCAAMAFLALIGHLYGNTRLYSFVTLFPMAVSTGICFLLLSAGILLARPDQGMMIVLTADSAGGIIARRLLPAAILLPAILAWLQLLGERAHLFSPAVGASLIVIVIVMLLSALLWWNAGLIHAADVERRSAQQELQRKNELLEQSIQSERQAHDDLKRTQGMLVQTEKLAGLGQLVAGVAHEVNNPLAFVSGNAAVLQRDFTALAELLALYRQADPLIAREHPDLQRQIAELCARIDLSYTLENVPGLLARSREGLRRIQQIVKDLREFARLDEGDPHEVDLNAGIESTVNIIAGLAKKKRIRIELDLKRLPLVVCQQAKVNQVVMNLLSNAIDASEEGGVVRVSTHPDADGVRIDVRDEGCGIDPAHLERIFDPFFTTKPQGSGMGLGLSISYGIIREHGGQIEVSSTPGKGTLFTVRLPLRAPARCIPVNAVAPAAVESR